MACIGCALCVDACNSIMDRFGLPGDLITYDSINNQLAREKGEPTRMRWFRPRILVYIAVLTIVASVMIFSLATRSRLEVNVLHDRSPLYVTLSDGAIRNGYTFKILNMEREAKTYTLTTDGIAGATMAVIGHQKESVPSVQLPVKPDDVAPFRIFVTAPRASLEGRTTDFDFVLRDNQTGETVDHEAVFAGPGS
jgi:polyferredoxin